MHDDYITLRQATEIAGLSDPAVPRVAIHRGTLQAVKRGRDWFTTREWLDDYLTGRGARRKRQPSPTDS
jgi:hypothetical protein